MQQVTMKIILPCQQQNFRVSTPLQRARSRHECQVIGHILGVEGSKNSDS